MTPSPALQTLYTAMLKMNEVLVWHSGCADGDGGTESYVFA